MKEFLKISDYETIENELASMKRIMAEYENDINEGLNAFENNKIVQDFYASGRYGSDIKERIQLFRSAVNEYLNALSSGDDSLVSQTVRYINNQINLLQQSSKSYGNSGPNVFMKDDLNRFTKVGVR